MQTDNLFENEIHKIAEEYRRRGYQVTIEPTVQQLPAFLANDRPHIVAEGPDESVVIEFKVRDKAQQTDNWAELANTVQQHPGWRLELVISADADRESPVTIPKEEIEVRLQEGLQLVQNEKQDASMLITWSAAEAAMRLASMNYEIELPDFRPAAVISRLYTEGILEREEYDFLLRCMRIRNGVAHGFREDAVDFPMIERLYNITLRLLHE